MKLPGHKIDVQYTPLLVSGNIVVVGGPTVQFFDGVNYYPDRASNPGSPIIISHEVDVKDPDGALTEFETATLYYENDNPITVSTPGYVLIEDTLKVEKNIPANSAVTIKAVTQFLDSRTGKYYSREDYTYLRTKLKTEAPYQLELSQRGRVFFDGYRNPNTTTSVDIVLRKGDDVVTDFTGLVIKWLNADGKDAVDYEAYAPQYRNDKKTIDIDKTYINNETIRCEIWDGEELIANDSVTFVRKFNSFQADVEIPQAQLKTWTQDVYCSVKLRDHLGPIDVDSAFLVTWMIQEGATERELGTGADISVPVSSINLKASPLKIYPDLKKRMAWAAIEDADGYILTDVDDKVLTIETYSN